MKNLIIAMGLITMVSVVASASPRNQRREAHQEARIQQGVASGQLNQREAARLNRGQARIDRAQDKAAADGVVTGREKHKLEKMQDRQNRRIYKEKHDGQTAPSQAIPAPGMVEPPADTQPDATQPTE